MHICFLADESSQEVTYEIQDDAMVWILLLTVIIGFGQVLSLAAKSIR